MVRSACLAALLLTFCLPATAAADRYTYLQADWIADADAELGAANDEADGFAVEGSYAVIPALFLQFDYSEIEDAYGEATEFTTLAIGVRHALGGYFDKYAGLTTELDICATAGYEDLDTDAGISGDGFNVGGGLRWQPVSNIEINPSIAYVDYGEPDDAIVEADRIRYALRGIFDVTDRLAMSAAPRMTKLEFDTPVRTRSSISRTKSAWAAASPSRDPVGFARPRDQWFNARLRDGVSTRFRGSSCPRFVR